MGRPPGTERDGSAVAYTSNVGGGRLTAALGHKSTSEAWLDMKEAAHRHGLTVFSMAAELRRFWLKFVSSEMHHRLGYGVTAWTEADALQIVQSNVFGGEPLPAFTLQSDINISILDAGHILPNMGSQNFRGIWYPRGYAR